LSLENSKDGRRRRVSRIRAGQGTHACGRRALFELKGKYGNFWQPPVLPELPHPMNPKAGREFYFKAMIYFAEGWEPRLAYFDGSAVRGGNPRRAKKYFAERLRPVMTHIREGAQSRVQPS
ncbi:hypothetical protein ACWD48_34460, partial [Streptomyces sp. NPDC002519]